MRMGQRGSEGDLKLGTVLVVQVAACLKARENTADCNTRLRADPGMRTPHGGKVLMVQRARLESRTFDRFGKTSMANIGFRIHPFAPAAPADLVQALSRVATAHLSDNMNRLYSVSAALRPCHKGGRFAGPALTVKVPPGDNLMVHKAIDIARPGDVIVVDAAGVLEQAIIGEIMSALAASRGVAGMIIDGAIRDADALRLSSFPVYARGVTHRGPYKNGPGEINAPVSIGGLVVQPGDLVVGDDDGLIVVATDVAPEVLDRAKVQAAEEEALLAQIRSGATVDRAWVDRTLREKGCVF
jgi:RraA family protein